MDPTANFQKLVTDWLLDPSHGSWLLIVDNADDIEDIFSEGPPKTPSGDSIAKLLHNCSSLTERSIVVTTRDSRLESRLLIVGSTLEVTPMSVSEALELLQTNKSIRARTSTS